VPKFSLKALFAIVAVLAIVLTTAVLAVREIRYTPVRDALGGYNGLSLLRNAERIEVYRLKPPTDRDQWRMAGVQDFAVILGPITLSSESAKQIVAILDDPTAYSHLAKGCIPLPGVRVDFIRGNDRLQVLLCYECMMLDSYINDERVGGADFDRAFSALAGWVQPLFPDDPKIQSLGK
jgi:hypothetical protein